MLLDKQMVVTPVTLKPYFETDPAIVELGGTGYLARLTADGHGLLAPRELAQQIYDLALLRELVSVGRELVEHALDTSEDGRADASRSRKPKPRCSASPKAPRAAARPRASAAPPTRALEMIETAINSGGHVSGKTTGFTSINEKCGGLHNSDLIILAGRPGMGKTSLATNIAFNCADRLLRDRRDGIDKSVGAGVAFFSLEMSSDQLATRILAEQAGIPSEALRMGKISRDDFQQLTYASQRLAELPLYIDDTPALTIAALRTRARRLKRRHDIGLIVVDYLQLLQGSRPQPGQPRQRDLRDQPRPQDAGQGAAGAGDRAVAAQPRGRAARGQAADAVRLARIRLDRAGRRHGLVRLPRGLLRRRRASPKCRTATTT